MYKVNFKIESNYALEVNGRHVDLHNNFDFSNFSYSVEKNMITLYWAKTKGDWLGVDEYDSVQLAFQNVEFLIIKQDTPGKHVDRQALSFLGYLHPDDIGIMNGCLEENEATSDYHMIFLFEDGLVIKLYAEKVSCIVA